MQGGPFLNWGGSHLVSYPGVFPDLLAHGAGMGLVLPLPDEAQAPIFVILVDQPDYGAQFADFAAPAGVHCRGAENPYGVPESVSGTGDLKRFSVVCANFPDVFQGLRELNPGVGKQDFVIVKDFVNKLEHGQAVLPS